jgi:hypothetical protein
VKVELQCKAVTFDQLVPGDFFSFIRDKKFLFGLCVESGKGSGAVVFTKDQQGHACSFIEGGLPHDDPIIAFPSAIVRPKLSTAIAFDGTQRYGSIVSTGAKTYVSAAGSRAPDRYTFDVDTGKAHNVGEKNLLIYPDWEAGVIVDQRFEAVFTFPNVD